MKKGISPGAGEESDVILIGADGFIGSSILSHLRNTGRNVTPTVFQRTPVGKEVFLDVTRPGDFSNLDSIPASGNVTIINASGLPDQTASANLMRRVHVEGMKNILRWAAGQSDIRIIQLSSVAVYGIATTGTGRTEAATRRRLWNPLLSPLPYGRTKARAEALLEKSGIPWTALRLPAVFGPGDSFFTRELYNNLSVPDRLLPSGGDKPVSIIPVECIGSLIERVLNHGPLNAARNAAGAHVPWKEILETYARAWNLPLNYSGPPRPGQFLDFSDPGMQMAAWYASRGAEFPDDLIRRTLNWKPDGDWRTTVQAAAKHQQELCRKSESAVTIG